MSHVLGKPVVRECRYYFDREELEAMGEVLDRTIDEISEVEVNKKEAAKHYASLMEALNKRKYELVRKRRLKYEMRPVDCRVLLGVPAGKKTIVRMDTSEEVATEPMTDADRQTALNLAPPEDNKPS